MRTPRSWFVACIAFAIPAVLRAQTPTFGNEFLVNTYTTGGQRAAAVAVNPSGDFVVVWESVVSAQDGNLGGVFGEKYNRLGGKLVSEFQVNTYTTGQQYHASVGIDDAGGFVVAWESYYQDGSSIGVFGQRFDSSGAKAGSEFPVNTYTSGRQHRPSIAVNGDGTFVVVWGGETHDSSSFAIDGQRFDATGTKVASEFVVTTYTGGFQDSPRIALNHAGNFVVVWESQYQDGSGKGIFGQRFDGSGAKVGPEFQVNTYTTGDQKYPQIAADRAGNFMVVWQSPAPGNLGGIVFGQRFNSSGEKVGPEFQIDSSTTKQYAPSVAVARDGGFVVVWHSPTAVEAEVFGQRYDRSGAVIGERFQVNSFTILQQTYPCVAADAAGDFVVAWNSALKDGSAYGVVARRRGLNPVGLQVDENAPAGTASDVNGVLEPNETVEIKPTWSNVGVDKIALGGNASSFTGPPSPGILQPGYIIDVPTADYNTSQPGVTTSCSFCMKAHVTVTNKVRRPSVHWDAAFQEDLNAGGSQVWKLHIGDSFSDVPRSQTFYKKIETLLHNGITSGCTTSTYCPDLPVSRGQMAIFVAKGIAGSGEYVPTTGILNGQPYDCSAGGVSRFSDVTPTDSFCRHVHYIGAQNVTLGCSATKYCPADTITRDAMASFIAKAVVAPGGGNAVPVAYGPDPVTGLSYSCAAGSPNLHFTDVPASNAFCKHIHYLWAKGIVSGCAVTQYCPGAAVARDAMAKFIANGFGLQLYGP